MSRVAVVTSSPPHVEGGHLVIARSLVSALRDGGHDASLVLTPSHPFGRQASAYVATWMTNVRVDQHGHPIDHVISLRYPSYAVRHRSHVCWLNHWMREYYDLWPRLSVGLSGFSLAKERLRRAAMHRVDHYLLTRNVRRVFAQSRTIQQRLQRFGAIESHVLYPPPPPRDYRCDEYGEYLFAVSRLTPLKRMDLLIKALADPAAAGVRCLIAGDGEQRERLKALIAEHRLETRVQLIGAVDDAGLVAHLARCRAVCFPAYAEDYGFVTVEAFASAKAVITCEDSGGPPELVKDGCNGFVCPPEPAALADRMARLMADAALAERLGRQGQAQARAMTWSTAAATLLGS